MVRWPSFYENKFFAGLIMKTISLPPRSALVHDPRRFPLRRRALLTSTALGAALLLWQPPAKAGPEGERIVAGQANVVRPNATTTLVTQASQSVLIDWRDFSIAANETVRFQQPNANALAINRVTGNQISNIFGSLQANGNVALINPAGVIIHNGATIDVGGLVASAHRLTDEDALNAMRSGRLSLTPGAEGAGDVVNSGGITVREGGLVALTGGRVANKGTITANLGKVTLGAGEVTTVDLAGDGLVQFAVTQPKGKASGAKVENSGAITAARVELSVAQAARVDSARE
jgi:filamentous hemagglutinin family protein